MHMFYINFWNFICIIALKTWILTLANLNLKVPNFVLYTYILYYTETNAFIYWFYVFI